MLYIFWILFFLNFALSASNGPKFLGAYKNYYFVETGTDKGEGVLQALKAGFSDIHSIEIVPSVSQRAQQQFAQYPNVHIWLGDSTLLLSKIIAPMDKPITFWLDAHCQASLQADHMNTAILLELEQIKQHPIKTHTILIDDMHSFGTAEHNHIAIAQLIKKIKEINNNYQISIRYDALIAQAPKN